MLFDDKHHHQVVRPPSTTVGADIYDNALLAISRRHKFGLKPFEAGPAHGPNVKTTEPAIRLGAHQFPSSAPACAEKVVRIGWDRGSSKFVVDGPTISWWGVMARFTGIGP